MVFFQINNSGIARLWLKLLQIWCKDFKNYNYILLNRGNSSPIIENCIYIDFPDYSYSTTETDSKLIQSICDLYNADLFLSTYYTTPLSTPSILLVYDMIPEVLNWNLNHPMWIEKSKAIRHASEFICISNNTAQDLIHFNPKMNKRSSIAYCGIDEIFFPSKTIAVDIFKNKYNIKLPYYLIVGERSSNKNIILFFKAISKLSIPLDFEIVCLGGQPILEHDFLNLTNSANIHLLRLDDSEMSSAYSGAIALIYPSLYEGFGMPIIEAMACGCPVITCKTGSIPEISNDHVLYVGVDDISGMINSMYLIQQESIRKSLISNGLKRSKDFSWTTMALCTMSVIDLFLFKNKSNFPIQSEMKNMNPKFLEFFESIKSNNLNEAYLALDYHFDDEDDLLISKNLKEIFSSYFYLQRKSKLSALLNLKKLGFLPTISFDVGAQIGTNEIYTTFPDSHHVLIEPVAECLSALNNIAANLKSSQVINCAVSDINSEVKLSISSNRQYSSIEENISDEFRMIECKTIDEIYENIALPGEILLKVDVDGPELKVLRGAKKMLSKNECVVIIEACLLAAPNRFGTIIEYLTNFDFVVYDIVDHLYRPSDFSLWQVDLIFVKNNSIYRENNFFK
jgi:FkbM family methyltransferase